MESDRRWLERRMLRELEQINASTDERDKVLHRQRAERYRLRLRNLLAGNALHHTL